MRKAFRSLASLYTVSYPFVLVHALQSAAYKSRAFLGWFMRTNEFSYRKAQRMQLDTRGKLLYALLWCFIAFCIVVVVTLIAASIEDVFPEGYIFAIALLIALPLVIALALMVSNAVFTCLGLINIKSLGKRAICVLLEAQVVRLRKKYNFTVVAVVGSVGKTSTKLAIAQTLELAGKRVRYQSGNYNDRLTVPLVVFARELPHLFNIGAWLRIIRANKKTIRKGYSYDVVVLELGTDAPGQIEKFAYLMPDILVVTAVAEEHMEFFKTIDAVAKEELSLVKYANKILINTDDVAEQYREDIAYTGYGMMHKNADYYIESASETLHGQDIQGFIHSKNFVQGKIVFLGSQGRKIVLAAAAVAHMLKVPSAALDAAITKLQPFSGRMQVLGGIKNSTIIDDTYNATPAAVEAALQVLTSARTSQRIAVLGNMNELGDYSVEAHKTIGASIDASKISLVVTIGTLARDYIAPAAKEQGCEVVSFLNPHEAGLHVKKHMKEKSVVLVKGSQNGVFSEEAIKPLLADKKDTAKLVRQSSYWMKQKRKQFKLPV